MKKNISLLIFLGILLVFNFVVAGSMSQGQPFLSLEGRIENIENDIDDIWEAIEGLQEPSCQPELEICDGIDNDCDGQIDEGCQSVAPVVVDNFNSYSFGAIVGQGGWESYKNGGNFLVQNITQEGSRALFINEAADSVIVKKGNSSMQGSQTIWISPDLNNWDSNGFFQVRLTKDPWASGNPNNSFLAVTFEQNGKVGYSSYLGGPYTYFGSFRFEWTKLDIEWRASDNKARYRINNESWTNWDTFPNSGYFTDFDYIGFEFSKTSGAGGIRIDNIH